MKGGEHSSPGNSLKHFTGRVITDRGTAPVLFYTQGQSVLKCSHWLSPAEVGTQNMFGYDLLPRKDGSDISCYH